MKYEWNLAVADTDVHSCQGSDEA